MSLGIIPVSRWLITKSKSPKDPVTFPFQMAMKLSYEWVFLTTYPSPGSPSSKSACPEPPGVDVKTASLRCRNCQPSLRVRSSSTPLQSLGLDMIVAWIPWLGFVYLGDFCGLGCHSKSPSPSKRQKKFMQLLFIYFFPSIEESQIQDEGSSCWFGGMLVGGFAIVYSSFRWIRPVDGKRNPAKNPSKDV